MQGSRSRMRTVEYIDHYVLHTPVSVDDGPSHAEPCAPPRRVSPCRAHHSLPKHTRLGGGARALFRSPCKRRPLRVHGPPRCAAPLWPRGAAKAAAGQLTPSRQGRCSWPPPLPGWRLRVLFSSVCPARSPGRSRQQPHAAPPIRRRGAKAAGRRQKSERDEPWQKSARWKGTVRHPDSPAARDNFGVRAR